MTDHPASFTPHPSDTLIMPTVHMNGTSKKDLLEGYCKIIHALHAALKALQDEHPNMRDYYTQPTGTFERVREQHRSQFMRINSVLQEIETIAEGIA